MVKCGVLFEVRTEFLNITLTSDGLKGLRTLQGSQFIKERSWSQKSMQYLTGMILKTAANDAPATSLLSHATN
jgi:hypothetical protein